MILSKRRYNHHHHYHKIERGMARFHLQLLWTIRTARSSECSFQTFWNKKKTDSNVVHERWWLVNQPPSRSFIDTIPYHTPLEETVVLSKKVDTDTLAALAAAMVSNSPHITLCEQIIASTLQADLFGCSIGVCFLEQISLVPPIFFINIIVEWRNCACRAACPTLSTTPRHFWVA